MQGSAKLVQRVVAVGGAALVLWASWALRDGGKPDWLWHAFLGWCVAVPYWHYVEHRLFAPPDAAGRRRFLELQTLSRTVWAGGAMVLAVALLRG